MIKYFASLKVMTDINIRGNCFSVFLRGDNLDIVYDAITIMLRELIDSTELLLLKDINSTML